MIETKKSFCRFCHAFCGVEVDVQDNRVLAVRGDPDNAVSQGYTCIKGRAEVERIHHPERLLCSKRLVNGHRADIAPEQALDEIAGKLQAIVSEHGPRSVAAFLGCGAHRASASGPWFVRRWFEALGSPSLYTTFTIDCPSLPVAGARLFGSPVPLNLLDIANADVTLFVGTNPLVSHVMSMPQSNPSKRLKDAQKRGMKLIVIDPRRCDVARLADLHLQVKPGEDATLLAGIIKIIIERTLYDREYVERFVSGMNDLHQAVRDFDLPYVSRRTRVPAARIEQAAHMFAAAERGGAQTGSGVHMGRHQNLTTQLVMTLNALCGRYDRRGGLVRNEGPLGQRIPANMGPVRKPLYSGEVSRVRGIRGTTGGLGFYSEMPSNTLTDEILMPGEGKIRALIVVGGNPALVFPDEAATVRALQALDLLVVNDLFLSATARFAHYVLAVKHPFERADVPRLMDWGFPYPFGQYTPPLVEAPPGTLEDWEIFWGLARRLGLRMKIPGISEDRKPTADEILDGLFSHARIPLSEIRKYPSGHVWGEREAKAGGVIPNMIGHPDRKMAVGHPEVIAELREVRAEPVLDGAGYTPGETCAFRLITYRMREVYCSQGQNLPSLRARRSFNPLLMNPEAMRSLGIKDGDRVLVESAFGRVEALAEGTEDLTPGVVALAFGWGDPSDDRDIREKGCNVQRLIPDDHRYDPVTGLALQTAIPVNVSARPVIL
jgi:anaerobic selenocysteine-containing dehydrogenase